MPELSGPSIAAWSVHKLSEFMAQVADLKNETASLDVAVNRVAEALDAEVACLTRDHEVPVAIGFPRGRVPVDAILAVAEGATTTLCVPGPGMCPATAVAIGGFPGHLVIARSSGELQRGELSLLKAMARVIGLVIRDQRVLDRERALREESHQRAELLERLARIQRSISAHAPLSSVLDAVTSGAAALFADPVSGLRLINEEDPSLLRLVSATGVPEGMFDELSSSPIGEGAGGRAVAEERLVVIEGYQMNEEGIETFRAGGLQAAMAAPIVESGRTIGSLAVASFEPGRTYSAVEQDALVAFADQAAVALANARLVEETQRALDEVTRQSLHDALTGLPNRVLLLDRLEHALERAKRTGSKVAVLFIDLDNFKFVNDTLGHGTGDRLIKAVARRLSEATRGADTAARLGGDEFAILLDDFAGDDPAITARRVLKALSEPLALDEHLLHVGASVGIAVGGPGEHTALEVLRRADVAMYRAKTLGKGRYATFEGEMQMDLEQKSSLGKRIRAAVRDEDFHLHFHPIVDLTSGDIVGAEALLRWDVEGIGAISPSVFIPLAEEIGLIVVLGEWVLREACLAARRWDDLGHPLPVNVNLSVFQLQQGSLVDSVRAAIEGSRIDPARLTLEITETMLFQDLEAGTRRLEELSSLGIGLALDDFGTGYSSLSYLDRFPIDTIKIDPTFTAALSESGDRGRLASSIVRLGAMLGLRTVGEGVETADQAERLRGLGCDQAQGYFFSHPMPEQDFVDMLPAASALS